MTERTLLDTWTAAKEKAEAEIAPIQEQYPADVVRPLFEAMTTQYFWEMWHERS